MRWRGFKLLLTQNPSEGMAAFKYLAQGHTTQT